MHTTCLISNYNYAHFVSDAIESALEQTVPFDEIIVVDDGSSDGSVELLRSKFANHRIVQTVAKDNQGQLSCFNEGFTRSTGDVVFFLDADDVYEPNYVEQAMGAYRRDPECDFVFCRRGDFGQRDRVPPPVAEDHDLGYSVILAAYQREWIGASTSCVSMRRHVLDKLLPIPFVEDWRVRADDCLVFGASLAGAETPPGRPASALPHSRRQRLSRPAGRRRSNLPTPAGDQQVVRAFGAQVLVQRSAPRRFSPPRILHDRAAEFSPAHAIPAHRRGRAAVVVATAGMRGRDGSSLPAHDDGGRRQRKERHIDRDGTRRDDSPESRRLTSRRRCRPTQPIIIRPPEATIVCPVMKLDSSLSRNRARAAISSG